MKKSVTRRPTHAIYHQKHGRRMKACYKVSPGLYRCYITAITHEMKPGRTHVTRSCDKLVTGNESVPKIMANNTIIIGLLF